MNDYSGYRFAYRCDVCGEVLAPGKKKGLCPGCLEEQKQRSRKERR